MSIEKQNSQSWEAWKGIDDEFYSALGQTIVMTEGVIVPYDGADAQMIPVRAEVSSDERANLPA